MCAHGSTSLVGVQEPHASHQHGRSSQAGEEVPFSLFFEVPLPKSMSSHRTVSLLQGTGGATAGGNCLGTHKDARGHAHTENTSPQSSCTRSAAAFLPSVRAAPDGTEPSERV